MVVQSYKPFFRIAKELRIHLLAITIYAVIVSWLDVQYHLEEYNFPIAIVVATATVIGLLLAFRTNAAYERWWEARIIWGAIVNDSRTWVRQLLEFDATQQVASKPDAELRAMAYRQIAWCYALCRSLRAQHATQDVASHLDLEEIKSCQSSSNVPNTLLLTQGRSLRGWYTAERLELYSFVELEKTLTRLTDSMGKCERIKNTVFPTSYTRMVNTLIYFFVILVPFGLVNVPAVALVPTAVALSFAFLFIDLVARYLQDPFSNLPSDTPMFALSRTIEINIREMLGETDLPEPMKPEKGILM